MWSVGVILYTLLVGYPPFASESQSALFQKIRTADYTFVEYDWKNISPSAQDLIRNLLTVDPAKRMTAKQALYESEWLRDEDVKRLSSSDLSSSVKQLRATRKHSLKSIAKMMIWGNSSSNRSIPSEEEDDEDQSEKKSE
jgi:serine/threonine protein kinase